MEILSIFVVHRYFSLYLNMISLDTSLFYFINNSLANPIFDILMPWITDLRNTWWLYIAMMIGSIYRRSHPQLSLITLLFLAVAVGCSDWINSSVLKEIFMRPRPCHTLPDVHLLVPCGSGLSFPSSHAANNASLIMFLYCVKGNFIFPIATFCFFVAVSRIVVGVHYPFDVIAGCLVGSIIGFTIAHICKTILRTLGSRLDRRK